MSNFYEKLRPFVGQQMGEAQAGPDVVNEAMIRHWCEAMGDGSPIYTDPVAAAASAHGGIVAWLHVGGGDELRAGVRALSARGRQADDAYDHRRRERREDHRAGYRAFRHDSGPAHAPKARPKRPRPPTTEDGDYFFAGAKQHTLLVQRCEACGHLQHPPLAACRACQSFDLTPADHSRAVNRYSTAATAGGS